LSVSAVPGSARSPSITTAPVLPRTFFSTVTLCENVTVENSFVDVYAGGTTYTFAAAIYLNDNGTTASDEISSYTIDGNILNEGIIVANGVGDPSSHTFGATQLITDNQFVGTFDYLTGEGRYDTVVLNGQVNGIGWLLEPTQIPTISGNTFANNARCRQTYNGLTPPGTCPVGGGCTAP